MFVLYWLQEKFLQNIEFFWIGLGIWGSLVVFNLVSQILDID